MSDSEHFINQMEANVEIALATEGVMKLYACFFMAIEAMGNNRVDNMLLPRLHDLVLQIDCGLLRRGERPLTPDELADLRTILPLNCSSVPQINLPTYKREIAEILVSTGVIDVTSERIMPNGEYNDEGELLYTIMPWSEYTHTLRARWTLWRTEWR